MLFKIIKPIDEVLNQITMYRLVLYYLIFLWLVALILSFFAFLPFSFLQFILSTFVVLVVCWITNKFFSVTFKAVTNLESVYISALILILIVTPFRSVSELMFIIIISIFAMASKYLISINKK